MYFGPVTAANVSLNEDTAMLISNFRTTTVGSNPGLLLGGVGHNNNAITFQVDRPSSFAGLTGRDEEAVVTISNVIVNVSREVPHGKYDIVVGGTAIANNWSNDTSFVNANWFDAYGITAYDVINVRTPGAAGDLTPVKVRIFPDQGYEVDGEMVEVDTSRCPYAFINADGRTMVPLRFVDDVLGMTVLWSGEFRTVSVLASDGHSVVFYVDTHTMELNGLKFDIPADENGFISKPEFHNDRVFLPFRVLGEAFGWYVGFDEDNYTPYYIVTGR
jgi:hypothetical protein